MKLKLATKWISLSVVLSVVATLFPLLHVDAAPVGASESIGREQNSKPFSAADPAEIFRDPCLEATSTNYPIPYNVAKACLDAAFPFPDDNYKKTLESVRRLVTGSYVFEDLAANPPKVDGFVLDKAPIEQDLFDLLVRVRAAEFNDAEGMTPREFHTVVSNILIRAHDAHLSYEAYCFRKFDFDFGFYIGEERDEETGKNVLKVQSTLESFRQRASLQFRPDGCEIDTINDVPAQEFIQAWADKYVSSSKDPNVRYNYALAGPVFKIGKEGYIAAGSFSRRHKLPDEPSLNFGFRCPSFWGKEVVKQVDVKWGAKYTGNYGILTVPEYYDAYCAADNGSGSDRDRGREGGRDLHSVTLGSPEKAVGQQEQHVLWDKLSAAERENMIQMVVEEFKAMPAWLAKRTQELILGPAEERSRSRIEWTDQTDDELLRLQAEKILLEMPIDAPVPELPIFEPRESFVSSRHQAFGASFLGYTTLLEGLNGLHAFLLADGKTGVLTIPTFHPRDNNDKTTNAQYYASLLEAIDQLRPVAERVILDVSGNGGGSPCLSRRFVEAFFPDTPPTVSNIRYYPLEYRLIHAGLGSHMSFNTPRLEYYDEEYLTEHRVTHPNRRLYFTNYITESCAYYKYARVTVDPEAEAQRPRSKEKGYVYDPDKPYYPWDAEDLVILSDGSCGSACATFANQLAQKNNVTTVVYGGGHGTHEPFSFSSFPGGQVLKSDVYFNMYTKLRRMSNDAAKSRWPGDDDDEHGAGSGGVEVSDGDEQSKEGKEEEVKNMSEPRMTKRAIDVRVDGGDGRHSQGSSSLLQLLPEPFQHDGYLSFTWRQTYNTGPSKVQFEQGSEEEGSQWQPTWGPPLGQWTEYSFLPAKVRIPYTNASYKSYHHLWEDARDAVWGPGSSEEDSLGV